MVGLIGVHVDDFLLAGCDGNAVFDEAKAKLEQSYRWGRWDEKQFTFAGVRSTRTTRRSTLDSQTMQRTGWKRLR